MGVHVASGCKMAVCSDFFYFCAYVWDMELIHGLSVDVKRTSQVATAEAGRGLSLPVRVS